MRLRWGLFKIMVKKKNVLKNTMAKKIAPKVIIKFISLIFILAVAALAVKFWDIKFEVLAEKVRDYPAVTGFFIFVVLYAFISVAPIPGRDIFKLVAAGAWGWWWSTAYLLAGEMLAAIISFFLARLLGKEFLDAILGNKAQTAYEKLNESGFRNVVILRILPIIPYRFFNFAAGVTKLKLSTYLGGSLIGIFIRTLFFQGIFSFFAGYFKAFDLKIWQIALFSGFAAVIMLASIPLIHWWKSREEKKAVD